jgi:hypothetical protein
VRSAPIIVLLLVAPLLTACGDKCRLKVTNGISDPADVGLTTVQVRLDGTSYWGDVDLLDGQIDPGNTRSVRVDETAPFTLDVRGSDSVGRTWTQLNVVTCEVPDEGLAITLGDADRDRPCTWTASNDTDVGLLSLRLRRSGTLAWAREVLEEGLEIGDAIAFVMDEDEFAWDVMAIGIGGDTWTLTELEACVDGVARDLPISGEPDTPEETR